MQKRLVALTEDGKPVGESHHKAKLTDAEVEQIRTLNEQGLGYRRLARKFEQPRGTIRDICKYNRRNATAVRFMPAPEAPAKPKPVDVTTIERKYLIRRSGIAHELAAEFGVRLNFVQGVIFKLHQKLEIQKLEREFGLIDGAHQG